MATMVGRQRLYDPADGDLHCDWPALLNEHRAIARRALRSVLGPCPDEEDLLQEVTLRLIARAKAPGEVSLGAWTWRVAHNVAVDHRRKRSAFPAEDHSLDRAIGDGLDDHVIAGEFAAAVQAAVERLPGRQREALVAHAALDGGRGTHAHVAETLGVSAKAAESLLGRARRSLRKELHLALGAGAIVAVLALARRLLHGRTAALAVLAAATVTTGAGLVMLPVWRGDPPARPAPLSAHITAEPAGTRGGAGAPTAVPPPASPAGTTSSPGASATPTTTAPAGGHSPPPAPPPASGATLSLPPVTTPALRPVLPAPLTVTVPPLRAPDAAGAASQVTSLPLTTLLGR